MPNRPPLPRRARYNKLRGEECDDRGTDSDDAHSPLRMHWIGYVEMECKVDACEDGNNAAIDDAPQSATAVNIVAGRRHG